MLNVEKKKINLQASSGSRRNNKIKNKPRRKEYNNIRSYKDMWRKTSANAFIIGHKNTYHCHICKLAFHKMKNNIKLRGTKQI